VQLDTYDDFVDKFVDENEVCPQVFFLKETAEVMYATHDST